MHDKSCYYLFCLRPHFTSCPFGFGVLRVYVCKSRFVIFFFFLVTAALFDQVNCEQWMHCSWVPQIPLFSHFFIKNGLHGTIHTFKNYFATVFLVLVFNFSKYKLNPNGPFIFASNVYIAANVKLVYSIFWYSSSMRAYITSQFFLFGWLLLLNSKC